MTAFAQMADGSFCGMTDEQERAARMSGLHTIAMDDGSWGWQAECGEDFGYATEEEAWAAGIQNLEAE